MGVRTASRLAVALLAAVSMTGCAESGSGNAPATADRSSAPAGSRPARPPVMAEFSCRPRSDAGTWTAVATVTNAGYRRADFQVTVAVTQPGDEAVRAARRRVGIAPGDSLAVRFRRVPAPAYRADLTCQARVTRR